MQLIVDKIENCMITCETEDKQILTFPLSEFPINVKEGDVIFYENGRYTIDVEATALKKQAVKSRFQNLLKPKNVK